MTHTAFNVHEVQRTGISVARVLRPKTVREALTMLVDEPEARLLAGGTDLLLELQRSGDGKDVSVVDVTGIEGFRDIRDVGTHVLVGGGVTHAQLMAHETVVKKVPVLAQACREVGSPQLRNRATLAGNLITASPANDTISALMAIGAEVVFERLDGSEIVSRIVHSDDLFVGFRQVDKRPGELLTEIRLPTLSANQRGLWVKLGLRRAQAISVVHAAIVVDFDGNVAVGRAEQRVAAVRFAIGSVAPTVVLLGEVDDALRGRTLTDEIASEVGELVAAKIQPISDGRATASYRSAAVSVLVRRMIQAVAAGSGGGDSVLESPLLGTPTTLIRTPRAQHIDSETPISISVNGEIVSGTHAVDRTLLDWVREETQLTGSKEGCAEGECGACTMLIDGDAVMSCLVNAAQVDGSQVTTIEAMGSSVTMSELQQAFIDEFAAQCGFCIPGFIVAAERLLEEFALPSREQILAGLSGNLCRCTGYYPMISAIETVADRRRPAS